MLLHVPCLRAHALTHGRAVREDKRCVSLSKQISASRVLPWLSDKLIFLFIQQISQAVSECHLKIMTWGFLGKDCSQTTCSVLQSSEGNFGDLPVSI